MNVARFIGSTLLVVWGMSAPLVQAQNLDSVLTNQQMSGGEMMTELVRLTMVPLAESPLLMRGMASFEFQSRGKTTLGEFRWNENDQLLWTDDVTLRSQMSLWMEDQKLAAYNLETQQGSFWPEAMVDGSGLLPSTSERITLKASKTESNLQFRDWTCLPYEGKLDKDRVMVWMAEEEVAAYGKWAITSHMRTKQWTDKWSSTISTALKRLVTTFTRLCPGVTIAALCSARS